MRPARLILLLVALIAGGLAAFLVMRGGEQPGPQVVTQAAPAETKTQILVAAAPIGVGERLSSAAVQWQDWPESAIRPEYVTISAMPQAPEELTGAVARFEFFPGEPIRQEKLVTTGQGYLSAVLASGKRGVSVPVAPATAAGGFIVPNDHVDVLLTRSTEMGQVSEVVLPNVRVLAIGTRLGEVGATGAGTQSDPAQSGSGSGTQGQAFENATIATLELDPSQAETLVNSTGQGELSLTLRSMADFNEAATSVGSSQTVRLIRFGREQSVMSGNTQAQPSVAVPESTQPNAALPAVVPASVSQPEPAASAPPAVVLQ
ncbi:Flp pilus assembly protein CpaB [Devosia sp. 1566]|uniref:Flp pilus assembly protein CpaB n=1 Tax=Devosia sp. 1566 TaxID=2499144 RepID=UPI000FDA4010|nr:Flp pilus assembly protein CpaB [Devosia sp. 1566]